MTIEQLLFCFGIVAGCFAFLTYKLWQYRGAIIKLQADMTLVLNELTRPLPVQLKKVK